MTYKGDRDSSGRKIPHELADSDFAVPLDTLILAISQHAVLDFFDDEPIAVTRPPCQTFMLAAMSLTMDLPRSSKQ